MMQAARGARLAQEAQRVVLTLAIEIGHRLERDLALQNGVVGAVNHAHRPPAEDAAELVLAEPILSHRSQ